jgi:hypothetical protein
MVPTVRAHGCGDHRVLFSGSPFIGLMVFMAVAFGFFFAIE